MPKNQEAPPKIRDDALEDSRSAVDRYLGS